MTTTTDPAPPRPAVPLLVTPAELGVLSKRTLIAEVTRLRRENAALQARIANQRRAYRRFADLVREAVGQGQRQPADVAPVLRQEIPLTNGGPLKSITTSDAVT